MSELKKHNSIIFLTTLSVYLGLVLVGGASSPILAQAALTRNFDIQEEIEYKDDLDKKPDDGILSLARSLDSYFEEAKVFAEDLQQLDRIEKINLSSNQVDLKNLNFVPHFNLKAEASTFNSERQRAEWIAQHFNQRLNKFESDDEETIVRQMHKFTEAKSDNNQFFLITNLPRASIDSLFAEKTAI
jgi:hypothetical protein